MTPILSSWSIGCSCKYIEYHIKYHQINTPDWLIYIFLSSYWQCKQVILGINNIFCQYVNWCPCVKIFHFSDEKQLTYFNCGCIVSYTVSSHYCMENVGTEELQLSVESWQANVRLHIYHCIYHTEDSMIISLELFWHHYQVLSASFMDELALIK